MSKNQMDHRCNSISEYLTWAEAILGRRTAGAFGDGPLESTGDVCFEPDPINIHEMRVVAKYELSFSNTSFLPHLPSSVTVLPNGDCTVGCLSSQTSCKTEGISTTRFLHPESTINSTKGEVNYTCEANGHSSIGLPSNHLCEDTESRVYRNGLGVLQANSRMSYIQSDICGLSVSARSEDSNHFEEICEDRWDAKFAQLEHFVRRYGHARVPVRYRSNLPLSKWAKRQRYQYKLKQEGKHSTLSDDREQKLASLGFEWDLRCKVWEQRFHELLEFKREHGHMNVPVTCSEFPKLGSWVKCARRQGKLFSRGQPSSMTRERAEKFTAVGFTWDAKRIRLEEGTNS